MIPEKWVVERTDKNCLTLNRWCNSHFGVQGTSSTSGWIHSTNFGSSGYGSRGFYHASDDKNPDHIEITYEQFIKYILNKNIPEDYQIF